MLSTFINNRRKQLNLSIDELSMLSGVPKNTVNKITAGITENPTLSTVQALCKALRCSTDDAIQYDVDPITISLQQQKLIDKYEKLDEHGKQAVNSILEIEYTRCTSEPKEEEPPTITIKHSFHKVSAGHGFDLNNEDDWEYIEVPDTPEARRADFSLTISGDSMVPIYSDGEIVLVKSQPSVDIGETGIFIVNGSGFIKKNGGDRLISLNPEYDDITFCDGDTVSCVGRVIGKV